MKKVSKGEKKNNIVCMRINDDEMEMVQKVVALTNKRASVVMRDALRLVLAQWVAAHPAGQ